MVGDGPPGVYQATPPRGGAEAVGVPAIAPSGARGLDPIAQALHHGKASAALLASLLHDGVLTVEQIKADLLGRGLNLRPLDPGLQAVG